MLSIVKNWYKNVRKSESFHPFFKVGETYEMGVHGIAKDGSNWASAEVKIKEIGRDYVLGETGFFIHLHCISWAENLHDRDKFFNKDRKLKVVVPFRKSKNTEKK